jgi:molybdopterin biosynthesis enzyme
MIVLTTFHPQTIDTNSPYLAKFCFGLGIQLKRVEVIPDDEEDIMEAVRRMSARYDFVVTSGGIGPTSVSFHPMPNSHPDQLDRELRSTHLHTS